MNQSLYVAIAQGDDENLYAYETDSADVEDTEDVFGVEITRTLWDELNTAFANADRILHEIRTAAGVDPEQWRLTVPCSEWIGHEYPAQRWYELVIPASGDEHTWPLREVSAGHFDSHIEAEAFRDALPESVQILNFHQLVTIKRADLTVERHGYEARVHECTRCGWSLAEHRAPSLPDKEAPQ